MGGGFVAIPLMTRLGMSQHTAHGTSLVGVFATGMAGAAAYAHEGDVDWIAAATLAVGGALTARFGAQLASKMDAKQLARALGCFMIGVAPVVPLKEKLHDWVAARARMREDNQQRIWSTSAALQSKSRSASDYATLGFIGLGSGFVAGLFGLGGGAIVVPLLALGSDLSHKVALGTSLAAMVPTAIAGIVAHAGHGNVNPRVAVPLAIGTTCGAYLGGRAAGLIPDEPMKLGFGGLMVILGFKTLLKTF